MSFTTVVKNEISKLELNNLESLSQLAALLKNSIYTNSKISFQTENASVARFVFNSIKKNYSITPKIIARRGYNYSKKYIYIIEINYKVKEIIKDLSINKNIPNQYLVDDDILIRSYLRGIFMAGGSINDPKTSRYHMEIHVSELEYANYINELLNGYFLNSKVLKRNNKYMIYIKEAEKIGDFLRMINAINALFYYEDIRIYRDHKNMTNRLNNCEQANVDKIINASSKQIEDIELIKKYNAIDLLDEKAIEAVNYRTKYPEVSLTELSEIITIETGNKITKSGLHHRLNKVKEFANKLREKETNKQ